MRGGGRLWIVGSDGIKNQIFNRLQRGTSIRFSDQLEPVFFEQLASERAVVRFVAGKPARRFERIKGARAEALDALAYAFAARAALSLSAAAFDQREQELRSPMPSKPAPTVIRSDWIEYGRRPSWW